MRIEESKKSFSDYKQQIEGHEEYGAFVTIAQEQDNQSSGKLQGVPYSAKDNICTKGMRTTASSKSLQDFVPYYDAKVIALLRGEGALLMGKNTMDELALGSTGLSGYGKVAVNPRDKNLVPGGSTSGGAVAVALGDVAFAMGTDTGGSVRQPAAYCGVVGVKPTYNVISVEGTIAAVSSMDTIGVLASGVEDSAKVVSILSEGKIADNVNQEGVKGIKIGIPKEYFAYENLAPNVKEQVEVCMEELKAQGAEIVEVSLPHFAHSAAVYSIIGTAEVSSNLGKIDGIRFGYRGDGESWDEIILNSRSEGFGIAAKERVIAGTYFLSEDGYETYLIPAQKMRTLIIEDYKKAFQQVDCLLTPTMPTLAYDKTQKSNDDEGIFTVDANLVGIPAISVPFKDAGVQIMANANDEAKMFQLALAVEKLGGGQ